MNAAKDRIWFAQMLRGLACLIVVYSHLGWSFWLDNKDIEVAHLAKKLDPPPPYNPPHVRFHYKHSIAHITPGSIGVSLFFLISGFVIPFSVERYRIRGFLTARAFRIFPVFWATLIINCLALTAYWSYYGDGFPHELATIATNATLVARYFKYNWMDSVAWTLSLEMLFYLTCAGMVYLGLFQSKRGILATTFVLSGFATTMGWYYNLANSTGYIEHWPLCQLSNDICFVIYMFIGTCFYRLFKGEWSLRATIAVSSVILLLWYYPTYNHLIQRPHWPATRRSYLAALMIFSACYYLRDKIPFSKVLDRLAEISYPLYLIHPVIGYMVITIGMNNGLTVYPSIALATMLGFGFAIVLHRFVEGPANRLGKKLAARWSSQKPIEEPPQQVIRRAA